MPSLISVIIPTFNRNDLLAICLDRLAPHSQTLDHSKYEVIVSDDGGSESTKSMISSKYPWVKLIKGPASGPAANRNFGAKNAKSEWLVFTDDDCIPEPNWLQTYYDAIQAYPESKAFEGAIYPTENHHKDLIECPVNLYGNCFWSANIMVHESLFHAVKGFDENYLLAAQEDQDFYLKIKETTSVPFLKNSVVYHPLRKIYIWKTIKKISKLARNWVLYCIKNKEKLNTDSPLKIVKAGYVSQLGMLIFNVKNRFPGKSLISLVWLSYGMLYIIYFLLFNFNDLQKSKV